ncbi:MAG: PEP-CTERM sorting domain-containing protein [bacterium]
MKKYILYFSSVMILLSFSYSHALSYTFYGYDSGGVGSADMDINISGNILTVTLNNTSPTSLSDNSGPNTPGITKFGFDLLNFNSISLLSWELKAYELKNQNLSDHPVKIGWGPVNNCLDCHDVHNNQPMLLRDPRPEGYHKWEMNVNEKINGVSLDYVPSTYDGIDGALFNPLSLLGENNLPDGNNIPFFTTSYLTMNFSGSPILDETSTYIRMQNVGRNGEGSLKLYGQPVIIPEPGTVFLLGSLVSGLLGFTGFRKKF